VVIVPELYKKYRPRKLSDVIGQPQVTNVVGNFLKTGKVPHAILLVGPSGTGKTTVARIIKSRLGAGKFDFAEINCADFRGIDMVRDIRSRMGFGGISGNPRVWLIDEAHKLTNDAQNAFLKILEDTPKHCYFMLATTEPGKIIRTVQTRCTELGFRSVSWEDLSTLVKKVAGSEGINVPDSVVWRIVEVADGSPRKALVLLGQVAGIEDEEDQLATVLASDTKRQAVELARALIDPRVQWGEIARLLKAIDDEPESLRRLILGYASTVCLGGGKLASRAALLLNHFQYPYYDIGKPGLVLSCWEAVHNRA
jgi:DNA polymerase-3 subunit gamma/tau